MPTEQEYKYVINPSFVHDYGEDKIRLSSERFFLINQGYLSSSESMTTRIRHTIEEGQITKWYLTFKQKVNNRVIEIETVIDERDGKDLWTLCKGRIDKRRFVYSQDNFKWEIDLFYKIGENHKDDKLYFVLAEVEVPEGSAPPPDLEMLRPYILHRASLFDDRFSNKKLGDVDYAVSLLNELLE